MARHRGKFDKDNEEPYELSRSRIENFVRCKACFYGTSGRNKIPLYSWVQY